MHELSIVFHVLDSVKDVAKENNVKRIRKVTLEIGEVSTVVNTYLADCWKWAAAKDPLTDGCELHIECLRAVTHCRHCEQDYPTVRYAKICPYCGSDDTYLLKGNEILIKDIEVE